MATYHNILVCGTSAIYIYPGTMNICLISIICGTHTISATMVSNPQGSNV